MPGFLSLYSGTERIPVGEADGVDYWVEIKKYLSREDYAEAQRTLLLPKMSRSSQRIGDQIVTQQQTEATFESEAYENTLVARAVTRWNLTDEDGVVLPLGDQAMASVARLPQQVFGTVYARLTELNNPKEAKGKDAGKDDPGIADVVEPGDRLSPEARFPGAPGVRGEDGAEGAGDHGAAGPGEAVLATAGADARGTGAAPRP